MAQLYIYQAKFLKDKQLQKQYESADWLIPIQVGAALAEKRICTITDDSGDNISKKNPNYCELTALYWIWKNKLSNLENLKNSYYGLFHYRRVLDISEEDVERMILNDVDAVLPFPTIHEPDISEHHVRYIGDKDWDALQIAVKEIAPEYYVKFSEIFSQPYFYNYNILVAKPTVLSSYCEWLFPILNRIEELCESKENVRLDRYMGYLGENLLTLYFLYNKEQLKIVHTGRLMLT